MFYAAAVLAGFKGVIVLDNVAFAVWSIDCVGHVLTIPVFKRGEENNSTLSGIGILYRWCRQMALSGQRLAMLAGWCEVS